MLSVKLCSDKSEIKPAALSVSLATILSRVRRTRADGSEYSFGVVWSARALIEQNGHRNGIRGRSLP